MIYTSRFSNPELKSGKYTVVGIVRGLPRFRLGYERAGNIIDIAPPRELFNVYDRNVFTAPYMAHLDSVGLERISAQIQKYVEYGKDVVLCCYEDVRLPDEWCHRLVFAEWWLKKTGEVIPELKDESPLKIKSKPISAPAEPKKKTEKPLTDDRTTIRVVYSLWANNDGKEMIWQGEDRFYQLDEKTGSASRISNSAAHELIIGSKAVLQADYDSVGKIEFVLADDSTAKTFLLNKKGDKREIAFKDALKLIANGMARIQDIKIE